MRKSPSGSGFGLALKGGASMLALAAMTFAGSAGAQATKATDTAAADSPPEVVVVGVRKALKSAQDLKKNADTQMDSITATDIGSFPDKSVAEALQRVPGITVTRFAASDDSSHFSAEPSGVLIRGLTQVRTEFNGRDSFSADGARGLNFADIAPELMAGIDSYKNQTADLIEGGIAGSVNLRTRLPFDSKGQQIALSAQANYGDLSKKTTYDYSAIYSNRWQTDIGEFGVMLDFASSHVVTDTNGVIMGRIGTYCSGGYLDGGGKVIVNTDGSVPCTSSPYGGSGWKYMPSNVTYSHNSYDRNRHGTAFAAQYQNNDHSLLATLQYNDSYYHTVWDERTIEPWFNDLWAAPAFNPIGSGTKAEASFGTGALTFGSDGMLQSGQISQHSDYWGGGPGTTDPDSNVYHAAIAPGVPFMKGCYDWNTASTGCTNTQMGERLDTSGRIFDRAEYTRDISANVKWDINDQLKTNFDVQYIKAGQKSYDILLSPHTQAQIGYSVDSNGVPQVAFSPDQGNNYASGFLTNAHNWYYGFVQDHLDKSDANELAVRADMEYAFKDAGWLDSLKVGVRYSDRAQKVRYSAFNWSGLYANWACDAALFSTDNTTATPYNNTGCGAPNTTFTGYKPGLVEQGNFGGSFYNGNVLPAGNLIFPDVNRLASQQGLIDELSTAVLHNTAFGQGWTPLCQRSGLTDGCYRPSEVLNVDEKTTAIYAMLKFGGPDKTIFNGITVSGNVGVRVIQTEDAVDGGLQLPDATWYNNANADPCNKPLVGNQVTNISCWLTPQLLAFSNASSTVDQFKKTHHNILPSMSVRFGLTDKQFIRFSASRAMSRPDMGQLRDYTSIGGAKIDTSSTSPYVVYNSATAAHTAANVVGYNFVFSGTAGNPGLAPFTADQYDLSYENYFSSVGSFTFDLFYKKLNGGITQGNYTRQLTNNGSAQLVQVSAGSNIKGDGGNLQGYEVAYQRFFDFLPGVWNGLGVQANFTHVTQSGINNSNLANFPGYDPAGTSAYGGGVTFGASVMDSHRLAGISDNSYNIVGLYEKGPFAARLAYNWRSKFLVNNLDVIIGLPVWEKDAGYLDASFRYKVSDNIELSIQGTNLTGTTAQLQQQIFGDSSATPGAATVLKDSSWIKSDRRLQLGIRLKY